MIFKIDPEHYRQEIKRLTALIKPYTNKDPYDFVVDQMEYAYQLEEAYGLLAVYKAEVLTNNKAQADLDFQSFPQQYKLIFHLCQYDNWQEWHALLKSFCKIDDWAGKYDAFPIAYFDLSNDPEFANAPQKVFPIETYNSGEKNGS